MGAVDYRILGSLEAIRVGEALPLGGAKQRAVLGILLVAPNRVVTTDELIESLWPERAPGKPQTAIQGYVSHLRRILDAERGFEVIVTEPAGYRLRVEAEDVDLMRFEEQLDLARRAAEQERAEVAAEGFRAALALFRGPPLADFAYESWAQPHIGRLEELHLTCLEGRIDADLALGRDAELVGEIETLVAEHPLRERLRAHLMVALYRAGRQSEALAAYHEARRVLVDEFGIEPSRALQDVERKILLQDPSLDLNGGVAAAATTESTEQTMVFTDIEGSTRLVHRLGDDYSHVLLEHRRLLREAYEERGGRVVDDHGDCFFATFSEATEAVEAAAAAQHALVTYPWPEHLPVRVRMGVHTGMPVRVGDGLIGLDVHRVARICAAAHGGQVLLSRATAELLDGAAHELNDLGEYRLKDLVEPEHLFQLVVADAPQDFPAPRGQGRSDESHPERSVLVVAQDDASARALAGIVEQLATSAAAHELIVAQLIDASTRSTADADQLLRIATSSLQTLGDEWAERGVNARIAVFTSAALADDTVRLASEQAVDLMLLERPAAQLEQGDLDSDVATVLEHAPCDVAICVVRPRGETAGEIVLVPFGGSAHDWAALELAAWLASANRWRLRLLGTAGVPDAGRRDASRLLAAASLTVQRLVGVPSEPSLVDAGPEELARAAEDAAIVVAGVPEQWRERGLGQTRAELLRAAPCTTLFVRRGVRPGGLAPRESLTRFTWSLSDLAGSRNF
jgi:DNA-binding SARP family transcriptional activator